MQPEVQQKIKNFFESYPLKQYSKNKILVFGGDNPEGVYHLENGHVRQYDITESGREIVVNMFKPPAFFPMSWALNHTQNEYFFEAFTDVSMRVAPSEDVVKFLEENPDVTLDLLSRVYRGTDGIQKRMALLMEGGSYRRVVFELLVEGKRFGSRNEDSTNQLHINEEELAFRAGLARETVNRELRKLKEKKIVTMNHLGINIFDLEDLERELKK